MAWHDRPGAALASPSPTSRFQGAVGSKTGGPGQTRHGSREFWVESTTLAGAGRQAEGFPPARQQSIPRVLFTSHRPRPFLSRLPQVTYCPSRASNLMSCWTMRTCWPPAAAVLPPLWLAARLVEQSYDAIPCVPPLPLPQVMLDDAHVLAASEDRTWTVWDVAQARGGPA